MMTKNELCWLIVNDIIGEKTATIDDILGSSQLAVALEHLGKLPYDLWVKDYAAERAGVMFCGPVNDQNEVKTLTLRDLLKVLPE